VHDLVDAALIKKRRQFCRLNRSSGGVGRYRRNCWFRLRSGGSILSITPWPTPASFNFSRPSTDKSNAAPCEARLRSADPNWAASHRPECRLSD
jgi:hypothetical protein